ncbi:MAG: hypothetical protein GXO43_09915 [Crenarchaeota archaeon]|nr:hypothetical protein [Thermoproteota archaeon]
MTCTKAQLLALFAKLEKEIRECRDLDCAISIIITYKNIIAEKTFAELERELLF